MPITLERKSSEPLTLTCIAGCGVRTRIERVLDDPVVNTGQMHYCAYCGNPAHATKDVREDFWELIAESYRTSLEVVKYLYPLWNREEFPSFRDYVMYMQEEARKYNKLKQR